jgi:hypothetical protein
MAMVMLAQRPETIAHALIKGMPAHFRLRYGSWIMSAALLGVGIVLLINSTLFVTDPRAWQYAYLGRIAPQNMMALICVALGAFRLITLVVNGTFPAFPWSPHCRAVGAFLSCFVWFNMVLGAVHGPEITTALPVMFAVLCIDIASTYIAMLEVE